MRLIILLLTLAILTFPACNNRQSADALAASSPPVGTSSDPILDEVCKITSELMGVAPSQIEATTSLRDLGCDELDFVELVMEIEESFEISIPDDTAEKMLESDDWQLGMKNVTMQKLADVVRVQKD